MMTPTLAKLFAMRIVASNSFGFDKKFLMSLALLDSWLFILTSSWGLRVKKATSAPEIRADVTKSPMRTIIEIILSLSIGLRKLRVIVFKKNVGFKVYF